MKRGDGYGLVGHTVRWIRGGVTGAGEGRRGWALEDRNLEGTTVVLTGHLQDLGCFSQSNLQSLFPPF